MRGGTGKTFCIRLSPNNSLTPDLIFFCFTWFYFDSIYPSSSYSFDSKATKFNLDLKIDFTSKHCLFTDSDHLPNPKKLLERDRSNFFLRERLKDCHLHSSPASHALHSVKEPANTTRVDWVLQADPGRLQKSSCSDMFVDNWELNNWWIRAPNYNGEIPVNFCFQVLRILNANKPWSYLLVCLL